MLKRASTMRRRSFVVLYLGAIVILRGCEEIEAYRSEG